MVASHTNSPLLLLHRLDDFSVEGFQGFNPPNISQQCHPAPQRQHGFVLQLKWVHTLSCNTMQPSNTGMCRLDIHKSQLSPSQLAPATTTTASLLKRFLRKRMITRTECSRPWTGAPRCSPLLRITPSLGGKAPRCLSGAAMIIWEWVGTLGSSAPSGKKRHSSHLEVFQVSDGISFQSCHIVEMKPNNKCLHQVKLWGFNDFTARS